jgi:hypothetical protein
MEQPLFALRPARNPRIGQAVKAAMCVSAALIALVAMLLPRLLGFENIYITGGMLAFAFLDFALAFVLPPIIEKQSAGAEYRFFHDRLVINFQGRDYPVTYENITAIEETSSERDRQAGIVNLRVTTSSPHNVPFFGMGTSLILSSLSPADAPHGKIKEVVEKSRRK